MTEFFKSPRVLIAIASVLGVSFGGVVGYSIAKRRYEEILHEEIRELKRYYVKKVKNAEDEIIELAESKETDQLNQEATEIIVRQNYSNPSSPSVPIRDRVEDPIEVASIKVAPVVERRRPHIEVVEDTLTEPTSLIEEEWFNADEGDGWDKASLTYYVDDDLLADENGEMIIDRHHVIGREEFLERLTDENPVIYVRNHKLEIDYEIVISHVAYAETVLGFTVDDN